MEIKRVAISKLKGATHNPSSRTAEAKLAGLMRSLGKIGLQLPILVTKDLRIVDGHRRVAAMKALGWDTAPILVTATEASPDEIYAEVNASAMKLTGNQNLAVFLKKPSACTDKARRGFENIAERFGNGLLKQIVAKGMSINVVKTGNRVASYLDIEDDKRTLKIIKWLILYRNSRMVHAYIETNQPARTLLRAIEENRPLKVVHV